MPTETLNNQTVPILTADQAGKSRYVQLTTPFLLKERDLLKSVASSLQAGQIPFCLVFTKKGPEIWRTAKGFHINQKNK